MVNFLDLATQMVNQYGFAVFPLLGKKPAVSEEAAKKNPQLGKGQGCKDATKDLEQIKIWAAAYPHANVGIATGPKSGVVVVDIDRMEALSELDLPETLTVQTGKGMHYYYATNGQVIPNSASKLAKGVDVRGEGGYVVGPGSRHPQSKSFYEIVLNSPLAKLPKGLSDRLLNPELPRTDPREIKDPQKYVAKAVEVALREIAACPKGGRNHLINSKAFLLGRYVGSGLLRHTEVATSLLEAARTAGSCDTAADERETIKTIESGLKGGSAAPRKLNVKPGYIPPKLNFQKIQDDIVVDLCRDEEMGDARLFCELIKGRKLYDHFAQTWLTYFDGRWQRDLTSQTTQDVYDLLKAAYLEVAQRKDYESTKLRTKPSNAEDDKRAEREAKKLEGERDLLRDRVKRLGASKRLRNILSLASGMASALSTQFDTDPLLLNLRNGTYDLRKFAFRPHRSEDLMTKMSHIHYDPDADCPYWEMFVADICGDDWDQMLYLKKIAGLMLTGRNDYQYLFFCYGRGANGKSTFFKQLQRILSEFFITLPIDILLTKNKAAADEYHLARLKGARVVMASEIPGNRRLNESLIKDLTSNDLLTARNPYEKPFQYEPSHKLFIVGNHKPAVTGMDHGIWRRIRLIPFGHTFPEEKRRPMEDVLAEFRQEEAGILNWMIEGYQLLLKEGLEMPDTVKAATDEYKHESDSIGVFLDEVTEQKKGFMACVSLKMLWTAYGKWCEEGGERPSVGSSRQFGVTLRERGFDVKNGAKNAVFVYGLELIERGAVG